MPLCTVISFLKLRYSTFNLFYPLFSDIKHMEMSNSTLNLIRKKYNTSITQSKTINNNSNNRIQCNSTYVNEPTAKTLFRLNQRYSEQTRCPSLKLPQGKAMVKRRSLLSKDKHRISHHNVSGSRHYCRPFDSSSIIRQLFLFFLLINILCIFNGKVNGYVVRRLDRFNEKSGNTLSLFTPSAVRHYDFVLTPITLSPHSYSYEQQSDEEKDAFKVPVVTHRGIQTSKKFISYVPSTLYISLRRRSVNNVVPLKSRRDARNSRADDVTPVANEVNGVAYTKKSQYNIGGYKTLKKFNGNGARNCFFTPIQCMIQHDMSKYKKLVDSNISFAIGSTTAVPDIEESLRKK